MSLSQAGRQVLSANSIPNPEEQRQQIRRRPIPPQHTGARMEELLGGRPFREIQNPVQQPQVQYQPQEEQNSVTELPRIQTMDSQYIRDERFKQDIQQRFLIYDQNIKELMYFVKNLQNRDANEIIQMRGMLQDKITEEGTQLMKEREKSKALVNEVVRIGENQQRVQEILSTVNVQFEQRIQALESKYHSGERALVQVAQKGDSGLNYINDWNDKLEKRVIMLESNLLTLGKEQLKDRDQLTRLDSSSQRFSEDLMKILGSIQQDYSQRLETRANDIVNRIIMEHEQRIKQVDELKINLDMREKLSQERLQYEREEIRERLYSLEQINRADSQRKEEALRQISGLLEQQVQTLYTNIKNEEAQRYANEIAIRNDLLKIQENIKTENEIFKSHQATITEKITDMIKIEVQNRLSSDVDLKNLTSAIASDIVTDLNQLKDTFEATNKRLLSDLKEIEKDSSEKAQRLSLYIDEEISKVGQNQLKKYEKLKIVLTKLAEQFKQHLINTEQNKQEVESRVKHLELSFDGIKTDFQAVIEELQEHLLTKIAEEKNQLLAHMDNELRTLEDKLNKIEDEQNKNFQILKEAIEENHRLFTERMNLLIEQSEQFHKETKLILDQKLSSLDSEMVAIRAEISEFQKEQQGKLTQISENLNEINIKQEQTDTQIKSLLESLETCQSKLKKQSQKFKDINALAEQIQESQIKLSGVMAQLNEQCKIIPEVKYKMDQLSEDQKLISHKLEEISENLDQKSVSIGNLNSKQTDLSEKVVQLNQRIDQELISQQQKDLLELNKQLDDIKEDLREINDRFVKKDYEIKEVEKTITIIQDKIKTLTKLEN